ncbi:MAG: hypothetical protein PSV35_02310, partial [bacterium]|nr:hypothetical protein [bacterium]
FIDAVSKRFLQNHLDEQYKIDLLSTLDDMFAQIERYRQDIKSNSINPIIDECKKLLRDGIANTAANLYESLLTQSDSLNIELKQFTVVPPDFNSKFELHMLKLKESPIDSVKHLSEELTKLIPLDNHYTSELLNRIRLCYQLSLNDMPDDSEALIFIKTLIKTSRVDSAFDLDVAPEQEVKDTTLDFLLENDLELLSELNNLHENIDNLVKGEDHIKRLANSPVNMNVDLLEMHQTRVVRHAAQILVRNNTDLNITPHDLSPQFFQLITVQAIALGAKNPVEKQLETKIKELNSVVHSHEQIIQGQASKIQAQQADLSELLSNLHKLKHTILSREQTINDKNTEILRLLSNITNHEDTINMHKKKIDNLTTIKEEQEGVLTTYKEKVEYLESQLDKSSKQISSEQSKHQLLNSKWLHSVALLTSAQQTHQLLIEKVETNQTELHYSSERISKAQLEHDQLMRQLNRSSDQLLDAKKKHDEISDQLKLSVIKLTQTQEEQQTNIEQLLVVKDTMTQSVEDLTKLTKQQKIVIKQLQLHKEKQAQLNIEHEELIESLGSHKEVSCAHLIEEKLIPETKTYLLHLLTKAQAINQEIIIKVGESLFPLNNQFTHEQIISYDKVVAKYTIMEKLLAVLQDTHSTPLPSARITQFTTLLQDNNQQLKQHRDAMWKQFCKNCLVAISVACSMIIPGIIGLLSYSLNNGKSSPLFFTKSFGEEYVDKMEFTTKSSGSLSS